MTVHIGKVLILEKKPKQIMDIFKLSIFNVDTWFGASSQAPKKNFELGSLDEINENTPLDSEENASKSTIFTYVRVTYAGQIVMQRVFRPYLFKFKFIFCF